MLRRNKKLTFILVLITTIFILFEILYLFSGIKIEKKTDDCNEFDCWDKQITTLLDLGGVLNVFDDLDYKIKTESISESTCHAYVHLIGEKAYLLFSENRELHLTEKTSYCGYGFYHGFVEAMLLSTGDYYKARDFCDYVRKNMSGKSNASYNACFHGFGHGIVDGSNIASVKDPELLISDGLEVCREIGRTDFEKDLCNSGIFNSLAILESKSENNIPWDKENPYWLCDKQTDQNVKKPCYEEMNTLVGRYAGGDNKLAIKFINKIPDIKYRQLAAQSYFGYSAASNNDLAAIAKECMSLDKLVKDYCISGFAGGLLEFGSPQNEYINVLEFCGNNILGQKEKEICYKRLAWGARDIYPQKKAEDVCDMITQKFQDVCS